MIAFTIYYYKKIPNNCTRTSCTIFKQTFLYKFERTNKNTDTNNNIYVTKNIDNSKEDITYQNYGKHPKRIKEIEVNE